MFRLFVALHLLFLSLYGCKGGYSSCIAKMKDSKTLRGDSLYIPVKNNKLLVYSPRKPQGKILKEDPFLSLYLLVDTKMFPYPFETNMRLQLGTAAVNSRNASEGKKLKNQVGLNKLGTYSTQLATPALITSSCCSLEGILTPQGLIQKEYIQRFLSKNSAHYGDIGIRVKNKKGRVVVDTSNPFLNNNPFKRGDILITLDGKKVQSASVFMRKILFSKIGTKHTIQVKRQGKIHTLIVSTLQRYGGGAVSDTFLEQKGIYFDSKLRIIKLSQYFIKYGLLVGDKLLQVNGTAVRTDEELLRYIDNFKDFSTLLFSRRDFQFFVRLD